jgi:hypothetical protein
MVRADAPIYWTSSAYAHSNDSSRPHNYSFHITLHQLQQLLIRPYHHCRGACVAQLLLLNLLLFSIILLPIRSIERYAWVV